MQSTIYSFEKKNKMKKKISNKIKFIDLFAGIGGTRIGFENACKNLKLESECVFTSEIKAHAIKTYQENFNDSNIYGDITKINVEQIPSFNFLLGGFPCQAFSSAGKRKGFLDTRGTLFFEIERILKGKRPEGFILENVEGLVNHDKVDKSKKIGRTLETILASLKDLGYNVSYKILNARDFNLAQNRKRIIIVGLKKGGVSLDNFKKQPQKLKEILEKGLPTLNSPFIEKLLTQFNIEDLPGKSIKDKRGGENNIHSWEIGLKGKISKLQTELLNKLLTERRKKHWAERKGIVWMDGMPLTLNEIKTFFDVPNLRKILDELVEKKYLKFEYPKDIVKNKDGKGRISNGREYKTNSEKGYNIVTGKLSFEINKILDENDIAPTLVATDVSKLAVCDGKGIRKLSLREGLRLFGFPESYKLNVPENNGFDLLGNTIPVNIVEKVSERLLKGHLKR